MDLIGLYLVEQTLKFGDSHILFLGRNYATFYFLPCKFKELNPGAQSLLWETRRHKLRSYSESLTRAASPYAPMLESTLSKHVSLSLFVHIGTKILLSVMWEEEAFTVFPSSWPLGAHHISPIAHQEHSRGQRGSRHAMPCKPHFCFLAQNWSPLRCHGCCPDRRRRENRSTTTLCLFTKSRQYGIVAVLVFANGQLDCMAGN